MCDRAKVLMARRWKYDAREGCETLTSPYPLGFLLQMKAILTLHDFLLGQGVCSSAWARTTRSACAWRAAGRPAPAAARPTAAAPRAPAPPAAQILGARRPAPRQPHTAPPQRTEGAPAPGQQNQDCQRELGQVSDLGATRRAGRQGSAAAAACAEVRAAWWEQAKPLQTPANSPDQPRACAKRLPAKSSAVSASSSGHQPLQWPRVPLAACYWVKSSKSKVRFVGKTLE